MKFRYYSDEFVYFNILGQDTSNGIINLGINEIFDSLKDCINYLYSHPKIYKILLNNKQYQLVIIMQQISDSRSSEPDNILYFCESGIFRFTVNKAAILFSKADINFRKTIDPSLDSATIFRLDSTFYYNDYSVNATEYFENKCIDRELSKYILTNNKRMTY